VGVKQLKDITGFATLLIAIYNLGGGGGGGGGKLQKSLLPREEKY
jgi:hypothetical protein